MIWRCGVAVLVCLATAGHPSAQSDSRGLSAQLEVGRVYDAILDARFDQVPALLQQTCPPAPREVCRLLDVVSLWWQIQLDPDNRSRDPQFRVSADAAIAAAEAWTQAEPQRAEAWFYLGGAYGARSQHRVLRGQVVAAARDGKRIKDALERALSLDPDLHDAYFGIGLYHYYADVAPAAAKLLRFLLLLPGGDKVLGLEEMRQARDQGQLLRSEADYQLHVIYIWYENEPLKAIALLTGLGSKYPRNPHFQQAIAEIQDVYLHDDTASLRTWEALLTRAERQEVLEASMAEARARLGLAVQLDRLFETDAALNHLRAIVAAQPVAPFGAVARAHLLLAQGLDRLGDRTAAVDAYRAAISTAGPSDPLNIAARARDGLRKRPDPTTARAYRLAIDAWRAVERGALGDASRLFAQSLALRPDDPVTRYRHARLLMAQRRDTDALTLLDALSAEFETTPPTIYAQACVDAARLHELRGVRARAVELYTAAHDMFGADQETIAIARAALTRLGEIPQR